MAEQTWGPGDHGSLPPFDDSAYLEGAEELPAADEADPRTDGVADQGELPPLSDEEIAAAVQDEEARRRAIIADPATPYAEDPADDRHEDQ